MRLRHLSTIDQAFFLVDHLEGEAREEIRYRPRDDPNKIIQALRELYGCTRSYVALQESFFIQEATGRGDLVGVLPGSVESSGKSETSITPWYA